MSGPKVFIGSSYEQIALARQIGQWLEEEKCVPVLWSGVFEPGDYTVERLLAEAGHCDGAILIFSEDDKTWFREQNIGSPRDNVVYELGLFTGAAKNNALKRAVFVRVGDSKVASDLKGLTYIALDPAAPSHFGPRSEISKYAKRLREFQSANESPLFHVTSKRELFRAGSKLIATRKARITLAAKTPVPIMGARPYDRMATPFEYEKQQYELYWEVVERAARGELEFTLIASVDSIIDDLKSCKNDDFHRDVNENLRKLFERTAAVGSKARVYWHEGLCPPAFLVADDTALIWWKSGNDDSLWIEHRSNELAEALASSRPGSYRRLGYDSVASRISASVGSNAV